MKNLTVTVPDEVYRQARIRAAERGTSVSAIVAAYLQSLTSQDEEFARLRELQRRTVSEITYFRASDQLDRDHVHDRAIR